MARTSCENCSHPTHASGFEWTMRGECEACPVCSREADINRANELRRVGHTLFDISQRLGRSKEWLREYAGLR